MFQSRIEPFTNSATFPKIFHDRPALTSLTNKQKKKEAHRRGKKKRRAYLRPVCLSASPQEGDFGRVGKTEIRFSRVRYDGFIAPRWWFLRTNESWGKNNVSFRSFLTPAASRCPNFPVGRAGGRRLFREMRVTFRALPLAICFGVSHAKWIREDNKTKAWYDRNS